MSFSMASRISSATSGLSRESGSLMDAQKSFFDVPSSRNMNIAVSIGGNLYLFESSIMVFPFCHSLSMRGAFCLTT